MILSFVEARCAEMLKALAQVTPLTHSRGVDGATLARYGRSQSKNPPPLVNYRWKTEAPPFSIVIYRWGGIFGL